MDKETKKRIEDLVKHSDFIVASPNTIEKMKAKGLEVESKTVTYKEYLDKLFVEKRKIADEIINKLPHLDTGIANSAITSAYDELRESFVLGIPGAAITMAIILLELALKYRLYDERLKDSPNSSWEHLEQIDLTKVVHALKRKGVITSTDKRSLDEFNAGIRNDYIHYKIKSLVKDLIGKELPSVDVETGEITIHRNVKAVDYPSLWFSAKRAVDKETVISKVSYCIDWVNKVLAKPT